MKAALIGVGQAGGKVTQALVEFDRKMGFDAIRGALAVNTATPDLSELSIDTLLVGQERVNGHGVGGDNELGAAVMQSDAIEVMDAVDGMMASDTEAIFVVAGLGGGTGSGGAPVLAHELKRVYQLPVYVVGILPGRDEGSMYVVNAGRSLKTTVREADATILIDNDAWRSEGESVDSAFQSINSSIARRLGLLLASGEVIDGVAESVVDSSEIINTLRDGGMAAVGYASAEASEDPVENVNAVTSITRRAVLTGTSIQNVRTADAALLVIAGRPEVIPRKGVDAARKWVEETTGSLQVRGGDFPLESERLAALVVLSGIERSERVDEFLERARQAADAEDRVDAIGAFENEEIDSLF